jgi:hypothetical protein
MTRLLLPVLMLWLTAPLPGHAQEVTIYRCTGPGGALTLRDSPCAKGETQDARTMQRPRDPPPGRAMSAPAPAAAAKAPAQREVQVVYRTPPRPMYECIDNDGERYTSDSDEGNPRWVPVWTLGYPAWGHHRGGGIAGPGLSVPRPDRPSQPLVPPTGAQPSHGLRAGVAVPAGGSWVRDQCHPLPQQEVCARLSDRRYEIIRRYNSAGTSERRQLELEQRGIDARLSNDCGTRP